MTANADAVLRFDELNYVVNHTTANRIGKPDAVLQQVLGKVRDAVVGAYRSLTLSETEIRDLVARVLADELGVPVAVVSAWRGLSWGNAPNLPHNGELMSVGTFNGNGDYTRLGCFQYCNDLSGMETCTGGPRTCPTTAW